MLEGNNGTFESVLYISSVDQIVFMELKNLAPNNCRNF